MKKLLIITTLILSTMTIAGEMTIDVGASSKKWVCKDLGNVERQMECLNRFDELVLDENNPEHLEMMTKAEANLEDMALYLCALRSKVDRSKVKVVQLTPATFDSRLRNEYYVGMDWVVVAFADFKCIFP